MDPRVAIVVLNWNGWRDTIECLESLGRVDYSDYWVILVDNGSENDSLARIRDYCKGKLKVESSHLQWDSANKPIAVVEYGREEALGGEGMEQLVARKRPGQRLVLIKNEKNLGFAEGNNVGIAYALRALDPAFVMLLNNDTVVDPLFLRELISVARSDERIGVLGPKQYLYDRDGRKDIVAYAGARILPWRENVYCHIGGEPDRGQYDLDTDTEWCTGAAMLIRRGLLERSLLNARYPFGNEDAEYCMRAAKAGARVVYVHKAKVWHKIGASRLAASGRVRRDILAYLAFIRDNFSSPWYYYHVLLFLIVMLPKWFFMDLAMYRDMRTLRTLVADVRKRLD